MAGISVYIGTRGGATVLAVAAIAAAVALTPVITGSGGFTCTTTISSGSVSTALNSLTAGGTLCLNAGSSYTYTASTFNKTSMTTVRAANGVAASSVVLSAGIDVQSSNNLKFQTMTVDGGVIGTPSVTATNIQFVDVVFTDGMCVNIPGTSTGRGILIDQSDFPDVDNPGCGNEGRLSFNGRNGSHSATYDQGVTVSNSLFHGPNDGGSDCSDMIQMVGDSAGVTIVDNEFEDLRESSCGVIHGDPIQFYGTAYTTLDGNYFHDNSTGLMNGDCNGHPVKLINNVFEDGGEIPANTVRMTGPGGDSITHNTFVGAPITYGTPNCLSTATSVTITNNAFDNGGGLNTQNSATVAGTINYNLSTQSTVRGANGINDLPTFTGGATPTTWAGYVLSAPAGALTGASDGTKMGINP